MIKDHFADSNLSGSLNISAGHRILLFVLVVLPQVLSAQQGFPPPGGARGRAMGGAGLTFQDTYASWSNSAGLGGLEELGVVLSGEQRFGISELQLVGVAAAIPVANGGFGIGVSSFGFDAYRDTRFSLGYGRKLLDGFRIGAELIGLNTSVENYSSRFSGTFSLGFQLDVLPELSVGTRIFSPIRVEVAEDEILPQLLGIGLGYRPTDQLLILAEFEQEINFNSRFRLGMEYVVLEELILRAGVVTEASELSFGAEYQATDQFRIGIVGAFHETLGWSPGVELVYRADR
ncbi:MAG: hypothetical protein AAF433_18270 [Bacteroidota bacterium]